MEKKKKMYKAALSLDSMPNLVEALKLPKEYCQPRPTQKKRRGGESTSEPEKERDQTSEISILGWFGKKKEEKKRPKRNREKGAKYIRTSISIGKPSTAKVPETGGCHPSGC